MQELISEIGEVSAKQGQRRFEEVAELFDDLKTNPVIADLRSIGFEALCALILRSKGYEAVELGRIIPWNETTRDVDVFGLRDGELIIIECKAYHRKKSISGTEVRKFFTETVPALKKWMRQNSRGFEKSRAEIWTTGPLGKDAETAIRELKCPATDQWALRRMSDMKDSIPVSIRARSLALIDAITLQKTELQSQVNKHKAEEADLPY